MYSRINVMPKSPAWTRKSRTEPQRWSERQRSRLLQNQVRQKGNLKAPVKGAPKTPEQVRRKGSFLVRMGSAKGPLKDAKGRPTRLKLSLIAWGHRGDKASAVAKGLAAAGSL